MSDLAEAARRAKSEFEDLASEIKDSALLNDPMQLVAYLWSHLLHESLGDATDSARNRVVQAQDVASGHGIDGWVLIWRGCGRRLGASKLMACKEA